MPVRGIKLHEYQAGNLLASYKVAIPLGEVAFSTKQVEDIALKMQGGCVVKSQILGGGRGLGYFKESGFQGGVQIVDTAAQAKKVAIKMFGYHLVTKQSGPDGLQVNCLYIVQKLKIKKEMYLSITLDRSAGCPVYIYSSEGGTSIEDVARENPEKIFKLYVDPFEGPDVEGLVRASGHLGLPSNKKSELTWMMKNIYDCFMEKDCDMIEINPLVLTEDNKVLAADSKITIDHNAVYRQPELKQVMDNSQ